MADDRLGRAAPFLFWSVGMCFLVYCVLGLLVGAGPFLFYPLTLLLCFGAMLPPALAGTVYLYLAGNRVSGPQWALVLAIAALLPIIGYYLWLLRLEQLSSAYASILFYPMIGGALVTALVAASFWPRPR